MIKKIIGLIKKGLKISPDFSIKNFSKDCWFIIKHKKNKASRDWIFKWNKIYKPQLNLDNNLKSQIIQNKIPLDIFIASAPKDFNILPLTIKSLRKNLKHEINNIYIVSPLSNEIKDICHKNNCLFIDETSVLGYGKERINYIYNGLNSSGWIFQQLLKLNADEICENEHILIIDSDTVFVRPRVFEKKGKIILDFSDEFHPPYYSNYTKLTGFEHKQKVSFICHCMLFEKQKLKKLKSHIECYTGKKWDEAIISIKDDSVRSYFSEYETYANFVLEKYKSDYIIEYWFNENAKRTNNIEVDELLVKDGYINSKIKTISFHSYNI